MPHDDFSDRKGVSEGQNDDQLGPSHQGQPRATILAIYGRAVGDRAWTSVRSKIDKNSTIDCVTSRNRATLKYSIQTWVNCQTIDPLTEPVGPRAGEATS